MPRKYVRYLKSGESLGNDEWIASENGLFRAVLQRDGNFLIDLPNAVCIWKTNSWQSKNRSHNGNFYAYLQRDGNFIIYDLEGGSRSVIWKAGWQRGEEADYFIELTNEGELAFYRGTPGCRGRCTWRTDIRCNVTLLSAQDIHYDFSALPPPKRKEIFVRVYKNFQENTPLPVDFHESTDVVSTCALRTTTSNRGSFRAGVSIGGGDKPAMSFGFDVSLEVASTSEQSVSSRRVFSSGMHIDVPRRQQCRVSFFSQEYDVASTFSTVARYSVTTPYNAVEGSHVFELPGEVSGQVRIDAFADTTVVVEQQQLSPR